MSGLRIAAAALALVGVPFRLNGRDPASGIDCVGLVELALRQAGCPARMPIGYGLRTIGLPAFADIAAASGLVACDDGLCAGDIIVTRPGPCQLHLLVCAGHRGFVHAHAGIRRVVLTPQLPPQWPVLARFRVAPLCKDHKWRR